jgi:hypothetical protein
MINYSLILSTNFANKQWALNGNDYEGLEWHDNSPKPTKDELNALWQTTLDKINANSYIAKRAAEYPPIGDQLDALWKGGDAAAEMLAKVQAVKAKYPKGATE